MKIKKTLYVYQSQYDWEDQCTYEAYTFKAEENTYQSFVGEQEVNLEVPDNFDPRAQKIAVLEKKRLKVMADYQKSITEINNRINNLQALEHTA